MSQFAAISSTSPAAATVAEQAASAVPEYGEQERGEQQFTIQCKLTVGAPDDPLELEADAMADRVMRMPGALVQRKCDACAEEEKLQLKPAAAFLQRKCAHCAEEEKLQLKPTAAFIQRKENSGGLDAGDAVSQQINATRGSGGSMDKPVQSFMEHRFGADFSGVRIHTGDYAVQLSRELNAQAFTVGRDIYFNEGKYNPASATGKHLLAHELTHTVQQSGMINRVPVPAPAVYHTFAEIRRMTITAFLAYVQSQADWFVNPALTDEERDTVRQLLLFINDDVAAVFGTVRMAELVQLLIGVPSELSDERADALRSFSSAASAHHVPFILSSARPSLRTAIEKGIDINRLRASFPDYVLHDAMNEAQFNRLRSHRGFVEDVVDYHDNSGLKPTFQADDGADFGAFVEYNRETGRQPRHYENTNLQNRIRNFHRFEKRALDRLIVNFGDTSRSKPVTLVLHTALDHNGAFHRDANLTRVIRDNTMLTLLVEGYETMAEYQAMVTSLAATYGRGPNHLIDQVMFAGHGNARSMQLAGKIGEDVTRPGRITEQGEGLNVNTGSDTATRSLLNEVLRYMANPASGTGNMSPRNRVVFNACLTGSNAVSQAVSTSDAAAAATAIQAFITANPSLSAYMTGLAANPTLTSIGSNASFGQVSLIDSRHRLDIISADDPSLTSSKLNYAEFGTEPTGTLRAALESWANDRPGTIAAMQRRARRRAGGDWDMLLIKRAYQIILDHFQADGESFRLMGLAVDTLAEMKSPSSAHAGSNNFRIFQRSIGLTTIAAHVADLIATVSTTINGSSPDTALALLQVWMVLDAGKQADFMAAIGSATCNFSVQFVDINFLAGRGLVSTLLGGPASADAKLRLALTGVLGNNNDASAASHLRSLLVRDRFPAALNLAAALGGASTETAVLTKLGVFSAPSATQVANIDVGATGTNSVFAERFNMPGVVNNVFDPVTPVRERPSHAATELGQFTNGTSVDIIGRMDDWYAIQFMRPGATVPMPAFIERLWVDTLRPFIY